MTVGKAQMHGPAGGAALHSPDLPVLPDVPTWAAPDGDAPVQWTPGFFAWFGALVTRIKNTPGCVDADGQLLGILGVAVQPPDPATTVPPLKETIFTGGLPERDVPKGVFDGYDYWVATNGGAEVSGTFLTTRKHVHQMTLPAAGASVLLTFRAQYRYKGQSIGRKSAPISVTVHG